MLWFLGSESPKVQNIINYSKTQLFYNSIDVIRRSVSLRIARLLRGFLQKDIKKNGKDKRFLGCKFDLYQVNLINKKDKVAMDC